MHLNGSRGGIALGGGWYELMLILSTSEIPVYLCMPLSGETWNRGVGSRWYHLTVRGCSGRQRNAHVCLSTGRRSIESSKVNGTTSMREVDRGDIEMLICLSQWKAVKLRPRESMVPPHTVRLIGETSRCSCVCLSGKS
jgi:hypothetical protein